MKRQFGVTAKNESGVKVWIGFNGSFAFTKSKATFFLQILIKKGATEYSGLSVEAF